jgi:hypothetical protein
MQTWPCFYVNKAINIKANDKAKDFTLKAEAEAEAEAEAKNFGLEIKAKD